jgi:hypothetical protein
VIRRLVLAFALATTTLVGFAATHASADPICVGTFGVPPNVTVCT